MTDAGSAAPFYAQAPPAPSSTGSSSSSMGNASATSAFFPLAIAPIPKQAHASNHNNSSRKRPRPPAASTPAAEDGEGDSPGRSVASKSAKGDTPKDGMRVGLNVKTRIHRACNACRKQKMRCEGPVNAPCNRCAASSLPCIFEKPSRETASSIMGGSAGDAEGLERLRTLETRMEGMQSTLTELVYALREGTTQRWENTSPSRQPAGTAPALPALSTFPSYQQQQQQHGNSLQDPWKPSVPSWSAHGHARSEAAATLPRPWESASGSSHPAAPASTPDTWAAAPSKMQPPPPSYRSNAPRSPHDGYEGEQNASLQELADAAERVSASNASSEGRGPTVGIEDDPLEQDVLQRGLIAADEALRLWNLFGRGYGRFVTSIDDSFFDKESFALARARSPFLFETCLAVGARVECASAAESRSLKICLAAAQRQAGKALFAPTHTREEVQALILLATYFEEGRLATEVASKAARSLKLDRSMERLYLLSSEAPGTPDLAVRRKTTMAECRIWSSLHVLDYQRSLGTDRVPLLSKFDLDGLNRLLVGTTRFLEDHKVLSTVDLMTLCSHLPVSKTLLPNADSLRDVHDLGGHLGRWQATWTKELATAGYSTSGPEVQLLELQAATIKVYLCSVVLHTVKTPHDVAALNQYQMDIAVQCITAAKTCVAIAAECEEFSEQLAWAPRFDFAAITFASAFLLKMVELFPRQVDAHRVFTRIAKVTLRLRETPGVKYGNTLLCLLWQSWKRIAATDRAKALCVLYGSTYSQQSFATAELSRGNMAESDFQELIALLPASTPSSPSTHPSSSVRTSGPGEPSPAGPRESKSSPLPWLNAGAAPQLPLWLQQDFGALAKASIAPVEGASETRFSKIVALVGLAKGFSS